MSDFNEKNQNNSAAAPNTDQNGYQSSQYTQQYQQTPPNNDYQSPQYTQQYQQTPPNNGYQSSQYTQQYQQTPPNDGYQPPNYTQQYQQNYQPPVYNYVPPVYQNPQGYSQKSRIAAALLAFLYGTFGVHNLYMGNTGKGVAQLLIGTLGALLFGIGPIVTLIWSITEGVQLLKDNVPTDGHGIPFID